MACTERTIPLQPQRASRSRRKSKVGAVRLLPRASIARHPFRERFGAESSPQLKGKSILSQKSATLLRVPCYIMCNKPKLNGVTKRGQVCPIPCPVPQFLPILLPPAETLSRSNREKHRPIRVHSLMRQRPGEQSWHNYLSELGDGEKRLGLSERPRKFTGNLAPQVPINKWINVQCHRFAESVSLSAGWAGMAPAHPKYGKQDH